MARNGNGNANNAHYAAVDRSDVPQGRKGKHRKVVSNILADLSNLKAHQAVKIPLSRNVERREILVRLASRPAQEYGRYRVAAPANTSSEPCGSAPSPAIGDLCG